MNLVTQVFCIEMSFDKALAFLRSLFLFTEIFLNGPGVFKIDGKDSNRSVTWLSGSLRESELMRSDTQIGRDRELFDFLGVCN